MSAAPQSLPPATKIRILDAAEKLFGMHGFEATSLRDITTEAQVNLAAVNYHFQTKESLIDAVIERRFAPVTLRRLAMLEAAGPNPSVEQVVDAFLAPMLMQEIRPAVPLIGRALSQPDQFVERIFDRHLKVVSERFTEAIRAVVPGLSREDSFWKLQFMAGSMVHLLSLSNVLPFMTGQPAKPIDMPELMVRLKAFLAAGLRAPVPQTPAPLLEKS